MNFQVCKSVHTLAMAYLRVEMNSMYGDLEVSAARVCVKRALLLFVPLEHFQLSHTRWIRNTIRYFDLRTHYLVRNPRDV